VKEPGATSPGRIPFFCWTKAMTANAVDGNQGRAARRRAALRLPPSERPRSSHRVHFLGISRDSGIAPPRCCALPLRSTPPVTERRVGIHEGRRADQHGEEHCLGNQLPRFIARGKSNEGARPKPEKNRDSQQLTPWARSEYRSGRCQADRRWSQTDRAPEPGRGAAAVSCRMRGWRNACVSLSSRVAPGSLISRRGPRCTSPPEHFRRQALKAAITEPGTSSLAATPRSFRV